MSSEAEIAWAAGLFEGEGCIVISSSPSGHPRVGLSLASTDLDVVERFMEVMQAGGIHAKTKKVKPHHKQQYLWGTGTNGDMERVLETLRPWFRTRRGARADEALAVLSWSRVHCRRGHPKPLDGRGCERCQEERSALITHCPHGHEYTPENSKPNGHGSRSCRRCEADYAHRRWVEKKAARAEADG